MPLCNITVFYWEIISGKNEFSGVRANLLKRLKNFNDAQIIYWFLFEGDQLNYFKNFTNSDEDRNQDIWKKLTSWIYHISVFVLI
jgi:hypothetical protein